MKKMKVGAGAILSSGVLRFPVNAALLVEQEHNSLGDLAAWGAIMAGDALC